MRTTNENGELVLADVVVDGDLLWVTTSAAPNTVRVYHGAELVCTISSIGTPNTRPSWLPLYHVKRSDRWRAIVEHCVLAEVRDLDLPGADPLSGTHEAA